MTIHAMARRLYSRGMPIGKRIHKTRCGIPLIELGPDEYSIDDGEVTCEQCLVDLNRPRRQDTEPAG